MDIINELGALDIYLIDQIMKGRYHPMHKVLDAGCGSGKNLKWFIENNYDLIALDKSTEEVVNLQNVYPGRKEKFITADLVEIPFEDACFDHIVSSAVLHFAESTAHFDRLFSEHIRVLKNGGTFFIRMCSDIGIEDKIISQGDGVFLIPDGTVRYLITRQKITQIIDQYHLKLLEPVKTTNVNDIRCMTTLLFEK